jgi:geranylgeranyl pyrophosphate synthase
VPTERFAPTAPTSDLSGFLARARAAVEHVIATWGERVRVEDPRVGPAIAYALESPGKRLRPALALAFHRELGGEGDMSELACAIEVVHCYSLVHDDLPCMDDDDMRRGRPTTHRHFGVRVATEAGYRMIPLASRVLAAGAARLGLAPAVRSAVAVELFHAAGARGMTGGQVLDLEAEGRSIDRAALERIHGRKTGALIAASAVIGALAAGARPDRVEAARRYGEDVGFAFQIADDLLDASASSAELGKTAGKDARQGKATFATVLAPAAARADAVARIERAVARLRSVQVDSPLLDALAHFMVSRRS